MKIQCTITLDYDSMKKAQTVFRATKIDDMDFVRSTNKGKQVKATIASTSVPSLLHTVDDYLACVSIAENVVDKD